MKRITNLLFLVVLAAAICSAACRGLPGRPGPDSLVVPPSQIVDFNTLYGQNCAGCHGESGKGGPAPPIGDPVFLAIADDDTIRRIASSGVPGTSMPAFAQTSGAMLTDKQIDALVQGIRAWAKPDLVGNAAPPSYLAQAPGDATRGVGVYATFCAACHGADGNGGKASSIVNKSYLALVSDQGLRTTVIVGRPELGAPDWRGDVPGRPMSAQEISDVVAWLAAERQPQSQPVLSPGPAAGGIR
jgi:cytochrome c oxidase cbb3-type subunit 3